MGEWIIILLLIIAGLTLLIVEIIFIPGTTVVGIAGILLAGYGVYLSFSDFGNQTGFMVLGITLIAAVIATVFGFRSGMWEKMALKGKISGKFNEDLHPEDQIKVGDTGVTVSSLRPMGNAEFNGEYYEVRTLGNFVSAGTKVKIVQIQDQKILVEPI